MSNTTDPLAQTVHGTNPQYLVEKITRTKIYQTTYWKEQCFGLTSESIVDKAISLKYVGGNYGGNIKPCNFLCLILKLLQLQPELEIVMEYVKQDEFKYLRALGAFYLRLVSKAELIYQFLEPLLNDYRKLSYRGTSGWKLLHMDEFVDSLLTDELVCDIALPHLVKRIKLEELNNIPPRRSALDIEFVEDHSGGDAHPSIDLHIDSAVIPVQQDQQFPVTDSIHNHANTTIQIISTYSKQSEDDSIITDQNIDKNHTRIDVDTNKEGSRDMRDREDRRHRRSDSYDRDDRRRRRSDISDGEDRRRRRMDSKDRDDRQRQRMDSSDGDDRRRRRMDSSDGDDRRRRQVDSSDRYDTQRRRMDSSDRDDRRRRRMDSSDRDDRRRRRMDSSDRDDRRRRRMDSSDRDVRRRRQIDSRDRVDRRRRRSDSSDGEDRRRRRSDSKDRHNKSARESSLTLHAAAQLEESEDREETHHSSRAVLEKNRLAEKRFDKMFGKSKNGATAAATSRLQTTAATASKIVSSSAAAGKAGKEVIDSRGEKVVITAPEGSVEYWNQMREALGMKKLK